MATNWYSDLAEQMKATASNPPLSSSLRKELYENALILLHSVEDVDDTRHRIMNSPMLLVISVIACDLGCFRLLSAQPSPMALSTLESRIKCDPELLGRVLRYLTSHGMITETSEGGFLGNNITRALVSANAEAGIRHSLDLVLPCLQILPRYLEDIDYINPSDASHGPFQLAHRTGMQPFAWIMTQPKLLADFSLWMSFCHGSKSSFLDFMDCKALFGGASGETIVFVDVGGGKGQQCALLKQKMPDVLGRVVLQDRKEVLDHAEAIPGVEKMEIDFWVEQPIKGARVYYMRNVLHDYTDKQCLRLLATIYSAMTKRSTILIDEIVMSETAAHWKATQMDFRMMATLASKERTETQWRTLLDTAGFKVIKLIRYMEDMGMSIIAVVPKKRSDDEVM